MLATQAGKHSFITKLSISQNHPLNNSLVHRFAVADNIVVLDLDGKITHQGNLSELSDLPEYLRKANQKATKAAHEKVETSSDENEVTKQAPEAVKSVVETDTKAAEKELERQSGSWISYKYYFSSFKASHLLLYGFFGVLYVGLCCVDCKITHLVRILLKLMRC